MEVEETIEEPSKEDTVEASMNEEEYLVEPTVEAEVECQPEETKESSEKVERTVSRHSDSIVSRRQVIRRHVQVSMVKKILDDEAKSSEEYSSSSDEQPSEEIDFEPVNRERSRVIRTAIRRTGDESSGRKVFRLHEKQTEEVPASLEVSDFPRKIEINEEVIPDSTVLDDVHAQPEMALDGWGDPTLEQPQVTRVAQRQDNAQSSRRQVIRSVVRETFKTTAREDHAEEEYVVDASSSTSSGIEEDQDLEEDEGDDVSEQQHLVTRLAIRGDLENITHRQVYRTLETETRELFTYENGERAGDELEEEILPEPISDVLVEEEPEYLKDVLQQGDEPVSKRTILRAPEDPVTSRQVIRMRVRQTELVTMQMNSEDEELDDEEEEELEPVSPAGEINGVYENGIKEPAFIQGDLGGKFDFLRTAVRQEEDYPLTTRKVFREEVAVRKDNSQINADSKEILETTGSSVSLPFMVDFHLYRIFHGQEQKRTFSAERNRKFSFANVHISMRTGKENCLL